MFLSLKIFRQTAARPKKFIRKHPPIAQPLDEINTEKLGVKLGVNTEAVLNLMQQTPNITIAEMARILNISETAIQNNIKKLKTLGIVEREGADKNGCWRITK